MCVKVVSGKIERPRLKHRQSNFLALRRVLSPPSPYYFPQRNGRAVQQYKARLTEAPIIYLCRESLEPILFSASKACNCFICRRRRKVAT